MKDPLLRRRSINEAELMDDPSCDPVALNNTYALFGVINPLVASWRPVYRRWIRPALQAAAGEGRTPTLLDVGSGGGDVARVLSRWATRDGIELSVTAIDPDPRAYSWALAHDNGVGVDYRALSSADLVAEGERFDVVVSNHVLHHLSPGELTELLTDTSALTGSVAVHNDLRRSRTAWLLYWVGTLPLIRARTFARFDGLLSVRRSYRRNELIDAVPSGWSVRQQRFFRLLAVFAAHAEPGRTSSSQPS
ncbi:methyltransferase [Kocuria sp. WRN011]|nr:MULTISPECIES: class I SAM-dependent methyltransferase [Kocuria]PBB08786.1 methyltransferase [Kocuria sp. WRN011]PZP35277.1 MAG: methyltransferase domain-containing protein [Kocuria rhizophila]